MPELKRVPQSGVMNIDITDRLLNPGQLREALNINISQSEGSDVGKAENLLGNILVGDSGIDGGTCIGAYRDNGNERIYFFVTNNNSIDESNEGSHGIFEYSQTTNQIVSLISQRPGFVSRPDGGIIGGQGTKDAETTNGALTAIASQDIQTVFIDATPVGQDLFFTESSANPVTGENLTEVNPTYYKVVDYDQPTRTITFDKPFEGPTGTNTVLDFFFGAETVDGGVWLNFHTNFTITGINLVDGLLFWTDNRNEPRKINVDRARNDNTFYTGNDLAAVAKYAPFEAPTITSVGTAGDSNFLEDKLPRFAYRWRFNDNELSTISTFTPIVFSSLSSITSGNIIGGEIPALVNQVKQVGLTAPSPSGFGITEVEFLYKESVSQNIYIIDNVVVEGETTSFTYNSQDPFRVLPGDQLTRVYDAVPRLAKAQEIAGGRIVYGNFLQNRNLPEISFSVGVTNTPGVFTRYSVKSRRTYQIGIVLADRYGRQSPVILSATGNDTVFVNAQQGNASAALQGLTVTFNTALPDWAHSYRIVVKQREQEYYNWFTSGPATSLSRIGDGVNKIPIDNTIGVEENATSRPSSVSVYAKIDGSNVVDNVLHSVSITTGGVAEVDRVATVYETEPVESLLDIFFETSTGAEASTIVLNTPINVNFYNCYILDMGSNHIEINRLRAGFNEPFFDVGVKAYVVQENFSEERRFNALIHSSGLFNSRTGINFINQFNEGEGGLTLGLDPSDGSIQKLYAEDTQLIIWQEDKVSRSPIDKDFIYSAEGGAVPVTSNTQYLGTVAPYAGEYGISTNPESFAVYGTRKYFTDRNRGVVLRLSQDGLSEISQNGLQDFFRDVFRTSDKIVGSYDEYHDHYNVTIVGEGYASQEDTNIATATDNYFTISFSESAGGWSSFKSYDQEVGLTLNNTYYTFNGGDLWQHNSEGVSRNDFYGRGTSDSYLDVIFNDGPSIVKEFKTIGYEGSEGWRCESIVTDLDTIGEVPELEGAFTAVLQVTAALTNATVSGSRSFIRPAGETVSWTLVFEPTSALYEFNDVNNITITESTGLVLGTPILTADSRIIQPVSYTIPADETEETTTLSLVVNGEAPLSPTGVILTLTLDDQVANANLNTAILSFIVNSFVDGSTTGSFLAIPEEDYYFSVADDVSLVIPSELATIVGAKANTLVGDNIQVEFPVNMPDSVTAGIVEVTGTALQFSRDTFTVTVPEGFAFTITPEVPIVLRDTDTNITVTIVVTGDEADTLILDVGSLSTTPNRTVSDQLTLVYTIGYVAGRRDYTISLITPP